MLICIPWGGRHFEDPSESCGRLKAPPFILNGLLRE
jgi:hypothetical protein